MNPVLNILFQQVIFNPCSLAALDSRCQQLAALRAESAAYVLSAANGGGDRARLEMPLSRKRLSISSHVIRGSLAPQEEEPSEVMRIGFKSIDSKAAITAMFRAGKEP